MKEKPTMIPKKIIEIISTTENVVLLTHVHPDGDALGSLLGLADILDSLGKNVYCFAEKPISHLYDFLPGCERVNGSLKKLSAFIAGAGADIVCIALDCGDEDRLGKYKEEFLEITPFLVIDHHQSHRRFGDFSWVEPERSSTGEMVYELAGALNSEVTGDGAYNIYVAICTDTGSFRYDCTGARTLQIASELVGKGVKPAEVGSHLYDNYTLERLKLMELVLATMSLCESEQIAFIHLSQQMLEKSGASMNDVEGFIDYPRSLRSVKVAAFIKEGQDGQISVSMRAKGECNVAAIAKGLDGGGHRNAAGFRVFDSSIELVRSQLKDEISTALSRSN